MKDINYLKQNRFSIEEVFDTFGTIELYEEILMDFYNKIDERIKLINDYLNNNDLSNYEILVHTIKGECAYIGLNDLKDISYNHQIESSKKNIQYIKDNINILINELNRIKEVIKKYFNL